MATALTEPADREKDDSKQDLLAKVTALESRLQVCERERSSGLFSKRSEFRVLFGGLEEVELKSAAQRRSQKQELKQSISRIRTSVASFQRLLTDLRPGPAYVEALKKAMEDIELSISAFKEKQRDIYEQLLQEEKMVSIELGAFEKKLDTWGTHKPPTTNPVPTVAARTSQSSVPPAVLAFERFLSQTGGREGGWEEIDHQTFVRIRTKYNDHPSYLEAAAGELPTKSLEDIQQHDQWYTEFLALLESKKRAIEEWRKSKQSSKVAPVSSSEDDVLKKKARVRERQLAREREKQRNKLEEWKAAQTLKHRQEEDERVRAEAEQCRLAERELKRKAALKAQVDQYIHEKELAKLADIERREEEKREEVEQRRAATKEVERFRERDMKVLEVRREKARRREEETEQRVRALESTKEMVKVARDPDRLFRLTAGWEERRKAGMGGSGAGPSLTMPRRAVPAWRQGL